MTDALRIRAARAADVPAIANIVDQAYRHYIARIGRPPGPMLDDYPARVSEGVVWVVEEGAVIAAMIVLVPAPNYLLLDNIAVSPARQGLGLGRRLLAFAEDEALRRGYCEIRLYTHQTMAENQRLYTSIGYEETGRGTEAQDRTAGCEKVVSIRFALDSSLEGAESTAEIDDAYRPQVLDLFGDEELADYAPTGPVDQAARIGIDYDRRRLKILGDRARALAGPKEDRKLARLVEIGICSRAAFGRSSSAASSQPPIMSPGTFISSSVGNYLACMSSR